MIEKKVLVFSTPTWATCKSAKDFLAAKGVPFTNRDIAEDESALKELEEKVPGASSTPIILVDNEVIIGFDRTKLQKALGLQWNYLVAADSRTLRSPIRQKTVIPSTA